MNKLFLFMLAPNSVCSVRLIPSNPDDSDPSQGLHSHCVGLWLRISRPRLAPCRMSAGCQQFEVSRRRFAYNFGVETTSLQEDNLWICEVGMRWPVSSLSLHLDGPLAQKTLLPRPATTVRSRACCKRIGQEDVVTVLGSQPSRTCHGLFCARESTQDG